MEFKRDNYIVIQGFAITDLKLSGNELICYSLIYGFTQDNETQFGGSLAYISSALNVTRSNAKAIIDRLIKKGLIEKKSEVYNGVTFCKYSANRYPVAETDTPPLKNNNGVSKTDTGVTETDTPPVTETDTNNIKSKDNNKIKYNIADQNDLFGETQPNSNKKTLFRNSEIYALADIQANDYSRFLAKFPTDEYKDIDLVYYFHSVCDWSESSNTKRTARGWLATIRNFIRGDIEKNRLHRLTPIPQTSRFDVAGAKEFLNL